MSVTGLVHWDEVAARQVDVGPIAGSWANLGMAGGSVTTGLRRIQLEAGRRSTPVHVHDAEEEVFYVLAGRGLSWQDGETCAVTAGDCVVHLAGGPAHTMIASEEGLDVLAFGTRHEASSARLPRAGVAWVGTMWVDIGKEPHPWTREVAAGELICPPPGERPATVVSAASVEPVSRVHGDTDRRAYRLAAAAGARLTGLNEVIVGCGKLNCPPHAHSAEEEIFVVLGGEGSLLLYPQGSDSSQTPEVHPVRRGSVVVRPAGTGVAHAFRAGADGLTLLAYGECRPYDVCFYPRSQKLNFRGLGVIGRLDRCGYWDGEGDAEA